MGSIRGNCGRHHNKRCKEENQIKCLRVIRKMDQIEVMMERNRICERIYKPREFSAYEQECCKCKKKVIG